MSDDMTHEDDDLDLDIDQNDADTDSANDTEEEEESSEDEQEQDDLELEDSQDKIKSSKAEENKRKQVEAWASKIESGKATMDDLPVNLKWLLPDLKDRLGQGLEKQVDTPDVKEVVKQAIAEERANARFEAIQNELKQSDLTASQRDTLKTKYSALRERGLSKLDAVELAMEVAQIDLNELSLEGSRRAMRLPRPGTSKKALAGGNLDDVPYSEVYKNIPEEKRVQHLIELTNNK